MDTATTSPGWSRKKRIVVALTVAASLGFVWYLLFGVPFYSRRLICVRCGEFRHESRLGGFDGPLLAEDEQPTALSLMLAEHSIRTGHKHDWRFMTGGGGNISCALGEASTLLSVPHHKQALRTTDLVVRSLEAAEIDYWFDAILTPGSGMKAAQRVSWMDYPWQPDAFRVWWTAHREEIAAAIESVRTEYEESFGPIADRRDEPPAN